VHFRPGIDRPQPDELENLIAHDDPREAADRRREWKRILSRYADAIDVLLIYQRDPELDAIAKQAFRLAERRGDVWIYHRDTRRDLSRLLDE
jgi:hypothetical protein